MVNIALLMQRHHDAARTAIRIIEFALRIAGIIVGNDAGSKSKMRYTLDFRASEQVARLGVRARLVIGSNRHSRLWRRVLERSASGFGVGA